MERKFYKIFRKSIAARLLLLFSLLVGGGNSVWGDSNITINSDGTLSTNSHFPFHGSFANKSPLVGQYIIPSSDISCINGNTITKILLYFSTESTNWGGATFKVYLKEVDNSTFEATPTIVSDGLTEVYSGLLSVINYQMEITFDNGFNYSGKNLLVSFNLTGTGTTSSANCYGKSNISVKGNFSNIAYQYNGYSGSVTYGEKYLPKMTLYYDTGGTPTDFSVSSSTYNSASLSWSVGGDETKWQIKYNAGADFDPNSEGTFASDNPITTNPYILSGLSENTTYYAYLRAYEDAENQSDWTAPVSFTTLEQYPTPVDFNLDNFTSSTATFSWTNGEGTEATAWQIKYSTTSGFNPDSEGTLVSGITSNPYTLADLTEGTTYYAHIRADYGSNHYSYWNSTEVEFTPSNVINILVNNGTDKSYNLPIQGSSANSMVKSQFVIPSSNLTEVRNRQITKLTFYADNSSISWGTAAFEVYLNEVSYTAFETTSFGNWGTKVFNSASLSVSDNEMNVVLDTPFNYNCGNLQIGIKQTNAGSNSSSTWLSVKDGSYTNLAIYGTGDGLTGYRTYYAPKVTISSVSTSTAPVQIGTTGFTTFASAWPLDLSTLPDGLTAYYASSQDGSYVTLTKATTEVSAGTGLVLKGTAGQTYAIPVAASGSDISGNLLVGVTSETAVAASATKYVLVNNGGTAEFQSLEDNGATIPAGKAYLNTAGASARLSILFDDNDNTATSIKTAKTIDKTNIIYNLMGQKVKGSKPGLYIKNGKKVVMK